MLTGLWKHYKGHPCARAMSVLLCVFGCMCRVCVSCAVGSQSSKLWHDFDTTAKDELVFFFKL